MDKDKRIYQRIKGVVHVRYAVKGRDTKKTESLPRNISGGGVGLCLTEKLQPGTLLELEIAVPDDPKKPVFGTGEVVWTNSSGIISSEKDTDLHETGIKFLDIDPIAVGRVYSSCRKYPQR
jgi:c-di-GMP-binding flagellar brake protein YcgR